MAVFDSDEAYVGINLSTSRIRPKIHDKTNRILSFDFIADFLGLLASCKKSYASRMATCSLVSFKERMAWGVDSMMERITLILVISLNCLDVRSRDLMSVGDALEMIAWRAS